MKAVNLRPLALFCLSFFLFCIILSTDVWDKRPLIAVLVLVAVLFFVIFYKTGRNLYFRSAAIIVLALSAALFFVYISIDKPMKEYEIYTGEHEINGKITQVVWSSSYNSEYVAELYEIDGEEVNFKVGLQGEDLLERGDTFRAIAELSPLTSSEEFNSRRYYMSLGAYLNAEAKSIEYTGENLDFSDRLYEINESLSARLVILMGKENGGIAASMFLGNRRYMSDEFTNAVTNLGLAHVIALSGMHLTVICSMLSIVLSNFGAKASRLCAIPIVVFYILLTGFSASIVRAGIMLICYNLISFTGRTVDQPTNLGISTLLIIVTDPTSICDIGFQLSVVAMLGVFATLKLMGGEKIEYDAPKKKLIKAALMPFIMSFISIAITMIPIIFYFGFITPAAIIASVPFSFFGDVILWLSPFALLFGGIPFIGNIICILCAFPCEAFNKLAILFGNSNKIVVEVRDDPQILCAALFSILFMMIFVLDSKKVRRIFIAISMAFLAIFVGITSVTAYTEYNSVILSPVEAASGEGFIVSSKGESLAVDISNGSQKVYRYLANSAVDMRLDDIDSLIITNPHSSHAYYLEILTDAVNIKTIWMPDEETSHYVASIIDYDAEIKFYDFGDSFEMGMYSVSTYADVYLERSVVPVVRLLVETEEKSLFYLGSAAEEAGVYPDKCDYLWIGGYGPKNKQEMTFSPTAEDLLVSEKSAEFYPIEATIQTVGYIVLDEYEWNN